MIKETPEITKTIRRERYCDVCGKHIHRDLGELACSRANCEMCGKDLCNKCVGHEEYTTGDYRTVYCGNCWGVGRIHRKRIEELEKEIVNEQDLWLNKCKENK